jgi:peptidase E
MKIILCGGGDMLNGELKEIDSEVINSSQNKNILVIDLSTNDPEKRDKYKSFLSTYFSKIGAEEISFMSDYREVDKKWDRFGIIYLPGGNPLILLENILKDKLIENLKEFNGILLSNSAGALVLSKHLIITKDEDFSETQVKDGLSLIPFSVEVHYDGSQEEELKKLSLDEDIYAIPEKNLILWENKKIEFKGNIKKFRGFKGEI